MTEIKLAVDIDDTLAQTNLFWARHHLQVYGSPEGLSAEDTIERYKFVKSVPYWQIDDAYNWVEAHIHSNEAKLEIPVIEEYIEVMRDIPVACYLTNRPGNTIDGTRRWLEKYGFPDREIIASNGGLRWKAQKLEDMFPEVSGIIDDNIYLSQHLKSEYGGTIFLYSNSKQTNSTLDVILCPTWVDVEKEVQRFKRFNISETI